MQLRDYVRFNSDFRDSVNLYLDLNKVDKIKSYIPTKSSVDILEQYLDAVLDNKQHSTLLIGPYGKGKSHLLLMLLAALTLKNNASNDALMDELCDKIKRVSGEVQKKVSKAYKQGKYLPVLIMSTQGDLNQAFLVGLNEALKRDKLTGITPDTFYTYAVSTINRWKKAYPDTYANFSEMLKEYKYTVTSITSALKNCDETALNIFKIIYPKLTSGSEFNPLVGSEVLPMYKNIADKLVEEYGYSGIYIVFDEFSKYIEGQDKKIAGNNMKILQDMCELANASKNAKIFITMVAHKSIKEYGKFLSVEIINSFTGIEGRIKEILFVTSSKNNYELIQNAIEKDEAFETVHQTMRYISDEAIDSSYKLPAFSGFTREDFEKIVVKGCYPLSPITAYLLLNISEKVAQNERTLFTFISKEEQYSVARTVKTMAENKNWIIDADLIYDYFKNLFKKDVNNEYIHGEWLNAEYALSQASDSNQKKMLKCLAVINIVNKPDELPADEQDLYMAAGVPDPEATLAGLCAKGLIYKKGSNNCYVFKTRATSELKTQIKKRMNVKSGKANFNKVLSLVSDTQYILPKHYNMDFTMTRYFRYEYMSVEEFLSINDLNVVLDDKQVCDGKVLALYSIDDIDYTEQISEKLNFCMNKKIVVIYSRKQMSLQDKLLEYEVLQEIKGDTLFFTSEENKVLLKEIPIIEDDLYREIYLYLDTAFEDRDERTIFYALTDHVEVDNKKRISDVVDAVCSQVYSGTLSVNNELINKENITTVPIKKARKTIIDRLIHGEDCTDYYTGTSAESTIYRALFVGTGIISKEYQNNAETVMNVFNSFIESACDNKQPLSKLLEQLSEAPIGMRKGIIPIYLAYALSLRKEDIVIYFDTKEMDLNSDIVLNMCESPDDYYIFISMEDMKKEQYLIGLCDLFGVSESKNKSESRLQNILLSMQRWFRALPQVTKNIKKQDRYFGNSIISKAFPKVKGLLQNVEANPYEVLMVDMPKAFTCENDFEKLIELLTELKSKLNKYYEWVAQNAVESTIEIFDKKKKNDLVHTLQEWYEEQSTLAKQGLHSGSVTGLMNVIADMKTFDELELVKKVVHSVTEVYLDSWNDSSMEKYLEALKSVKEEIEGINDENASTGKLELSFVGKNGEKIVRYYEHVNEGTGTILKNMLSDNLEDFSDLSVNDKVAILLEMIEKQLS